MMIPNKGVFSLKSIGLLGGMSWESSLEYYRILNEKIHERLGGFHSAKVLMFSFDFAEIEGLQHVGNWQEAGRLLGEAARSLETAGADVIVIATNTMHKLADEVEACINIPLLHIVDTTAHEARRLNIQKAGLLGTRFTMEEDFYRSRLKMNHGIETIIPEVKERALIHNLLYDDRSLDVVKWDARKPFRMVTEELVRQGAEGIILGCTEIPLMIFPQDFHVPLLDTTRIHAEAAADFALS